MCINSDLIRLIKDDSIDEIIITLEKDSTDLISSAEAVVNQKRTNQFLGLVRPAEEPEPTEEQKIPKNIGPSSSVAYLYFVTLSFPRNQKFRLNKKTNLKWSDYKTKEQKIIIDRITGILNDGYHIVYEFGKDTTLHAHIICNSDQSARDLSIDIRRFYAVPSPYFADVKKLCKTKGGTDYIIYDSSRPVLDQAPAETKEYLSKDSAGTKSYSISGIPPTIG